MNKFVRVKHADVKGTALVSESAVDLMPGWELETPEGNSASNGDGEQRESGGPSEDQPTPKSKTSGK